MLVEADGAVLAMFFLLMSMQLHAVVVRGYQDRESKPLCVRLQAAILTGRRSKTEVSVAEIDDSVDRIVAGMEGTPMVDSKSKSLVAYHEVGHAVCGTLTPGTPQPLIFCFLSCLGQVALLLLCCGLTLCFWPICMPILSQMLAGDNVSLHHPLLTVWT